MLYAFDHQQFAELTTEAEASLSDDTLVEMVAQGNDQALETLRTRHSPVLRTIIGHIIREQSDADEVCQDVFLDIWKHAGNYQRDKGHAMGWIVTLARRRAIDRVRRVTTYSKAKDRYQQETVRVLTKEDFHTVENKACTADFLHMVVEIMDDLPPKQREVIHYVVFEGLTQREVARLTCAPLGTTKTRIELGLRKIRDALIARSSKEEWLAELIAA